MRYSKPYLLLILALPLWALAGSGTDIPRRVPPRPPEFYGGYRPTGPESEEYRRLGDAIGRAPDELDVRVDAGYAEIGARKDGDKVVPTELTIKTPATITPEVSIPFDSLPTPDKPELDLTKFKAGIAVEAGGQELKAGAKVDLTKTADDYYGDDQQVRDSALLSTTENAVAKFDIYYGGAAGKGTNYFNFGGVHRRGHLHWRPQRYAGYGWRGPVRGQRQQTGPRRGKLSHQQPVGLCLLAGGVSLASVGTQPSRRADSRRWSGRRKIAQIDLIASGSAHWAARGGRAGSHSG